METTSRSDRTVVVHTVATELTASLLPKGTSNEKASGPTSTHTIPDRLEDLTASASVWTRALSLEHDRLHTWQQRLGYPVVAISAVTGLTAFTQLDGNPAWWATLAVALAAAVAAVLAAAQTHGNFATRAQTAAEYSQKFGDLLGEMLVAAEKIMKGAPPTDKDLEKLYADYGTLRAGRPSVRPKLFREAQDAVIKHSEVQRDLAAARAR